MTIKRRSINGLTIFLVVLLAAIVPGLALAQMTPTPTSALHVEVDLTDVDAVMDALIGGQWGYVGPVSGLDRSVKFLPNLAFWNTDPRSKTWDYYADGAIFWTYDPDRQAVILVDSWGEIYSAWEIESLTVSANGDTLTVDWWDWETEYAEEPVTMERE